MSDFVFYEHANYNKETEKPEHLVIILHGYGANGSSIIEIAKILDKTLPNTHFVAPNAPNPWEGGFVDCYQWFSLSSWGVDRDPAKVAPFIIEANEGLSDFVQEQLNKHNLQHKDLFLAGFSQGAMMSIFQGLTMTEKLGGIISFSGKVILPEFLDQQTNTKQDICLMHGDYDSVLPFSNFEEGKEILEANDFNFEHHALEGLDHTIDMRGLAIAQDFINKQIAKS